MSVKWQDEDFTAFFGATPLPASDRERPDGIFTLSYVGRLLRYKMYIDVACEAVHVSGDPETPFGAESFFEVSVPCDSIAACVDGYHPEQTSLLFWYGDPARKHNVTLQLLKRPDGDLKVWPSCVWPSRHQYFTRVWGHNQPPIANEPPAKP